MTRDDTTTASKMQQQTFFSDSGIQQQFYEFKTTEAGLQHQNDDEDSISLNFSGTIRKARFHFTTMTL